MLAFSGVSLGILFSFLLLAVNAAVIKVKKTKIGITPKNYLRLSMVLTAILCLTIAMVDDNLATGGWIVFLFAGFQAVCILASYLLPEEKDLQKDDHTLD